MRLRVLSLNVWGLPAPAGRLVEERLARIAADLPDVDADLALFQEVWTERAREQLIASGPGAGLPHHWPPAGADDAGGLLALSRHPIRHPAFRTYRLCGLPQRLTQMDYYSGKGIGRFDVDLDGVRVAILNTHLHARYSPPRVQDEYIGHRSAEVIELADELRHIRGPAVLAGDLNMRDVSPEYRLLKGLTGLVDAAAALDVRQPTSTLQNAYRQAKGKVTESRIDYVLSRSGAERGLRPVLAKRVFDRPLTIGGQPGAYSDHAGMLVELALEGPGLTRPPVRETVFELGHLLLAAGRERAQRRQLVERVSTGVSATVVAAAAATLAIRSRSLERRRFLRLALGATIGLAGASTLGLLGLSELFVPQELADLDQIEALLDRIEADKVRRAGS